IATIHITTHPLDTLIPYTTLFRSIPFVRSTDFTNRCICNVVAGNTMPDFPFQPVQRLSKPKHLTIRLFQQMQHQSECCLLADSRSEEHTSELQSRENLVCRLLLEK